MPLLLRFYLKILLFSCFIKIEEYKREFLLFIII